MKSDNVLKVWDEFLIEWPEKKVLNMTLEDYTDVKSNNPKYFTYCVEFYTKDIGEIRGATNDRWKIYKSTKGKYKIVKGYPNNPKEAFDKVHSIIKDIIRYVKKEELEKIEQLELSDLIKWKIAFLYQNKSKIIIPNMFSKKHLDEILKLEYKIKEPPKEIYKKYKLIMKDTSFKYVNTIIENFYNNKRPLSVDYAKKGETKDTINNGNKKISTTIQRYIRDTKITKKIKEREKFSCQLCPVKIKLPNGKLYVEAHHIKPLGEPHCGEDRDDNIIIVCPNCHTTLDYSIIELNLKTINNNHYINQEFVDYHNNLVREKINYNK